MTGMTTSKSFLILLLRGVLGGALGGFVWAATPMVANIQSIVANERYGVSLEFLLFLYVLIGLPFGAFIGGLVGTTIWLIHRHTGAHLGPLLRIAIGTLVAMSFWGLWFWPQDSHEYIQSSWQWNLFGVFLLGTATGGLPGLIVGRQEHSKKPSEALPIEESCAPGG